MTKITGAGIACLDYIVSSPGIQWGDTALISNYSIQIGGLIAMALITCRHLGADCNILTHLGTDDAGNLIINKLENEGISIADHVLIQGAHSPFSFIHVDDNTGERTIFHRSGSALSHNHDVIDVSIIDGSSVLLVDDIYLDLSMHAAKYAQNHGIPVVADLIPDMGNSDLLRSVDVLIAPRHFMKNICVDDAYTALDMIHDMGPSTAVITLGSDGYVFSSENCRGAGSAFKVDPVDTTGAGDVFHGAFAFGMSQLWDVPKCAEFASAVAAIKCTGTGPAAIPTLEQTSIFLKSHGCKGW